MSLAEVERRLVGTWRHSHEEDVGAGRVYRPESFDFPPSRGREGFALAADQTGTYLGLSPRDGTARAACTWRLSGRPTAPVLQIAGADGRRETWVVLEVTAERLVLAPQ